MADTLDLVAFGERLRKTRLKRQLTLQQVFDQTAVSVPTLSRIERGEATEIESSTLVVLARWMGVSLDSLVEERSPSQKHNPLLMLSNYTSERTRI